MHGLTVLPSGRAGRGRLFVNLPDGRAVAWYDRRTNRVSLLEADRREAVLAALRPYLSGEVAVGPPPVPTPVERLRLALPPTGTWPRTAPASHCWGSWRTARRAPGPVTGCAARSGRGS